MQRSKQNTFCRPFGNSSTNICHVVVHHCVQRSKQTCAPGPCTQQLYMDKLWTIPATGEAPPGPRGGGCRPQHPSWRRPQAVHHHPCRRLLLFPRPRSRSVGRCRVGQVLHAPHPTLAGCCRLEPGLSSALPPALPSARRQTPRLPKPRRRPAPAPRRTARAVSTRPPRRRCLVSASVPPP